jgi:hypothetical protein
METHDVCPACGQTPQMTRHDEVRYSVNILTSVVTRLYIMRTNGFNETVVRFPPFRTLRPAPMACEEEDDQVVFVD